MLPTRYVLVAASLVLPGAAGPALAQASLYLPLDDARLPLLEHLIARGDVADPTPMVRPFRLASAVRVLAAADTAPETSSGRLIRELRTGFSEDTAQARWQVQVRVGADVYTQKRKDPLHQGGEGTANPYADVALRGVFGPAVLATRAALEPRLIGDPDWPNQAQDNLTGRLTEGYLSLQFKYGNVTYGQLERNWGPVGYWAYPDQQLQLSAPRAGADAGHGDLRLDAIASDLQSESDSLGQDGQSLSHRPPAGCAAEPAAQVALWESIIIAGPGRILETPVRQPDLADGDREHLRHPGSQEQRDHRGRRPSAVGGRTTVQAQLALDDFLFNTRDQGRDRWALTLAGVGSDR